MRALDLLAAGEERGLQRLGLDGVAREAVDDDALAGVESVEPLEEHLEGDRVGDELTLLHVSLGLATEGRSRAYRRAEEVPGRHVREPESLREDRRLGALAGTRRPEQDEDSHRMKPS